MKKGVIILLLLAVMLVGGVFACSDDDDCEDDEFCYESNCVNVNQMLFLKTYDFSTSSFSDELGVFLTRPIIDFDTALLPDDKVLISYIDEHLESGRNKLRYIIYDPSDNSFSDWVLLYDYDESDESYMTHVASTTLENGNVVVVVAGRGSGLLGFSPLLFIYDSSTGQFGDPVQFDDFSGGANTYSLEVSKYDEGFMIAIGDLFNQFPVEFFDSEGNELREYSLAGAFFNFITSPVELLDGNWFLGTSDVSFSSSGIVYSARLLIGDFEGSYLGPYPKIFNLGDEGVRFGDAGLFSNGDIFLAYASRYLRGEDNDNYRIKFVKASHRFEEQWYNGEMVDTLVLEQSNPVFTDSYSAYFSYLVGWNNHFFVVYPAFIHPTYYHHGGYGIYHGGDDEVVANYFTPKPVKDVRPLLIDETEGKVLVTYTLESNVENEVAVCGDGTITNPPEECDFNADGSAKISSGVTCQSLGYDLGVLSCALPGVNEAPGCMFIGCSNSEPDPCSNVHSLELLPPLAYLDKGAIPVWAYEVWAILDTGERIEVTSSAEFSTTFPSIATISESYKLEPHEVGVTIVKAEYCGKNGWAVASILPENTNQLSHLYLAPFDSEIGIGETQDYELTAYRSDGSEIDVTTHSDTILTSSLTTIASITGGVATGKANGVTYIGARYKTLDLIFPSKLKVGTGDAGDFSLFLDPPFKKITVGDTPDWAYKVNSVSSDDPLNPTDVTASSTFTVLSSPEGVISSIDLDNKPVMGSGTGIVLVKAEYIGRIGVAFVTVEESVPIIESCSNFEDQTNCEDRSKLSEAIVDSIASGPELIIPNPECHEFELDIGWADTVEGKKWLFEHNEDIRDEFDGDGDEDYDSGEMDDYVFDEDDFTDLFDYQRALDDANNPCGKMLDCRCEWDVPIVGGTESCLGVLNPNRYVGPTDDSYGSCPSDIVVILTGTGRCQWSPHLINKCSTEGIYELKWTALWYDEFDNPDPVDQPSPEAIAIGCVDGSRDFQCPTTSFVPFFTLMNLLVTVLGISFVYFVFSKK
ncbi:MAG: hypothetical protein U9Q06_03255 [Nanoarchaeota archaeon]|nr:hypothetical protein [Nanoarchaeota archaeon]